MPETSGFTLVYPMWDLFWSFLKFLKKKSPYFLRLMEYALFYVFYSFSRLFLLE